MENSEKEESLGEEKKLGKVTRPSPQKEGGDEEKEYLFDDEETESS